MGKRKLGRGLTSIMNAAPAAQEPSAALHYPARELVDVPLSSIRPNPWQPRTLPTDDDLAGLARSIAVDGVIQPLVVRRLAEPGQYELVAGERRWRAARLAGLQTVPAVLREVDDGHLLELALVENLQRADLNPIERAKAYRQMIQKLGLTQEQAAQRLGEDRSTVANTLRLLELPEELIDLVSRGTISPGHARAILTLPTRESQVELAKRIVAGALSVRASEALAGSIVGGERRSGRAGRAKPAHIREIEDRLQRALGTKVMVEERRKGGRIVIEFYSGQEFDRLLGILEGEPGEEPL